MPKLGFDLDAGNVAQHWLDEPDLRLWLRGPAEVPFEIDLVLKTRKIKEFDFSGAYLLKVASAGKTLKRSGRASCTLGALPPAPQSARSAVRSTSTPTAKATQASLA
ncbi:hypothetical protein GJ654_09105 [Rhodoblastus acidophilus]|uniref:Uncharacterized protein n=1 Tax=Rhodoblastus acidophilus TaxID=1074 RepID=A0A6N8DKQ3_RHOAC|nr:hypothetical protein [Rhodoblastus acidophilus]MCW2274397.1 hypothetical protein [Rhodoblastus acidophilus]MTV31152.1 hypothetical protein [Rhodoblastus acidophilus]